MCAPGFATPPHFSKQPILTEPTTLALRPVAPNAKALNKSDGKERRVGYSQCQDVRCQPRHREATLVADGKELHKDEQGDNENDTSDKKAVASQVVTKAQLEIQVAKRQAMAFERATIPWAPAIGRWRVELFDRSASPCNCAAVRSSIAT